MATGKASMPREQGKDESLLWSGGLMLSAPANRSGGRTRRRRPGGDQELFRISHASLPPLQMLIPRQVAVRPHNFEGPVMGWWRMAASVKGFGCRPVRAGLDRAEGRRPKASRGGSRGPGPWAMGISPRGMVGGIVRGARRRCDAPTEVPGSRRFGCTCGWIRAPPRSLFPRSARAGSPALWPRPVSAF